MAFLYRKQGRYAEAEPFYLEALEMGRKLLGSEHPNTQTFENNLYELRQKMKTKNPK
ncbi:MAG: tetratricopeptide repeat protein [Cyanobacteria bacterium P01_C01_bin.72]